VAFGQCHLKTLRTHALLIAVAAVWIPAVGWGTRALLAYSYTPGAPGEPARTWPRAAPVPRSNGRPQLLLFVHGQCPCSRATIGELARVVARYQSVDVTVIVYNPAAGSGGGTSSDLWHAAAAIPGVRLIDDPGAALSRLFGAVTSGQTMLYAANGDLVFTGGITASRGHAGDNDGVEALLSILGGQPPRHRTTPVFGCSLRGAGL
jgi:hypothetical protein